MQQVTIAKTILVSPKLRCMEKKPLHQVFIANVTKRMADSAGLKTQVALSKKAGMSQSFLSEILSGQSIPTIETVAGIAEALGCQAWELLADSEATRKAALERMILGSRLPDERAAQLLPPAPTKEVAAKRRKKGGGGESPPH